jgi:hypothetical protein
MQAKITDYTNICTAIISLYHEFQFFPKQDLILNLTSKNQISLCKRPKPLSSKIDVAQHRVYCI